MAATEPPPIIAVIGGGPAGLMAAEVLSVAGLQVNVFDAMPSVARKFLLAGRGGLNLTHAEAPDIFVTRYGKRRAEVGRWLDEFGPQQLRDWAHALGIETFVGSSGRVFPQRDEGRAAAARLASPPARRRRDIPCAPSLAGLG